MSLLSEIFKNATGGIPLGKTGISFNPIGSSFMSSGIKFPTSQPTAPVVNQSFSNVPPEVPVKDQVTPPPDKSLFPGGTKTKVPAKTPTSTVPPQYINPKTGTFYTPEEFAKTVGGVVPKKSGGDIPQYAGDTLTQGPQTVEQLQNTTAGLNNARNDIATGETDPYKVASQSGIAYSPDELSAIEKAYAGIYDPAINSALAKLNKKQEEDLIKFNTDENIRQYNATTGAKSAADASKGSYVIQPGDDLRKIAAAKGYTYEAIKAQNSGVDEYNLKPGQVIELPTGVSTKEKAPTQKQEEIMAEEDYIAWLANYKATNDNKEPTDEQKAAVMRSFGLKPSDYNMGDI